ncbi:outer membrane protein, partial [Falsiroseomonas sp. HW251]|uniref:outer membrane protein n=1 Tax=Falsiroseomonas sp. HW251 TaxID=3390998 RepID=UPI003D312906
MSLRKALLAATVLALPVAAQAQPVTGLYVGAGAGVNWLSESDLKPQTPAVNAATGAGKVSFNTGFVGVVSLGYGFGNGVRVEGEFSFRTNDVSGISGFPNINIPAPRTQNGDVQSYGFFANVFYDFNLGPNAFVYPYIGAGAGYVIQNWNSVTFRGPAGAAGPNITVDGDNNQFAWQAIAGLAFPIAAVPGLSLTAEYRYMQTLSGNVDTLIRTSAQTPLARGQVDVDNQNQSLLLGIRYAFGVAPPPPPVAPAVAPAPART